MALEQYMKEPEVVLDEHDQSLSIVESAEQLHELDYALEEIARLSDMEQGLKSLQSVVESLESPTANELALIRTSSNLAVAGSNVDYNAVFPGLESIEEGQTVSTEGLSEVIARIWKAIMNTIQRIWDTISSFFGKIANQTGRLRKQNENMRARMSRVSGGEAKSKDVEIDRDADQLLIQDKIPNNTRTIIEGLWRMSQYGNVVYQQYSQQLINVGQNLTSALNGFDMAKPEESLAKVVRATDDLRFDAIKKAMGQVGSNEVQDKRWADRRVMASMPMLGNRSLFFIASKADANENNVMALSERARVRRFLFKNTIDRKRKSPGKVRVKTVAPDEAIEIYQINKLIIDMVADYANQKDKYTRMRRQLEKAGDALQKRADKSGPDVPDSSSVYVKEALQYVVAYSSWSANPVTHMASQMFATVRAAISLCNKSAQVYE